MADSAEAAQVLQKGWTALRENPVLVVPPLIALLIVFVLNYLLVGSVAVGMMGAMMAGSRGMRIGSMGAMAGTALLIMGLSIVLSMVAGGTTVAMAHDTLVGRPTSLRSGLAATQRRLADLIIASILSSALILIGFLLFFVPGLVAAFFLLFTLPAVMLGGVSGTGALSASVRLVGNHLGETLILSAGLLVIGLLVGVVGVILRFIPVLGVLVTMILQAGLAAYAAAVIVAAYRRAEGLR